MLQTMRSGAKYIWVIIAVLFVGGFLFYESSGLFGRGPNTTSTVVGSVNGREIPLRVWTQATQRREQEASQQVGRQLTLEEAAQVKQEVFDQLVTEILLEQEYARRGIGVTDAEVIQAARTSPPPELMRAPELQTNGQFDMEKYQRFLSSPMAREQGILAGLEGMYRAEIPREKLFEAVVSDIYVTDDQLWSIWRDTHDTAQVSSVAFTADLVPDSTIAVSDAELRQYYDTHHTELTRSGRALLSVVTIPRTISAADTAAALRHIQALRDSLAHGSTFAGLAKRESADSASAANGGSLGWGKAGRFVTEFEVAGWRLKPGQISEPVLSTFGYHLIRMDGRNGDSAQFSHILIKIQQTDSAAARTNAQADSLEKLAAQGETPAQFDRAAKVLGLKPVRIPVAEGAPAYLDGRKIPSISAWAFGGAHVGEASDLQDADSAYYLARLDSLTPGGLPAFEQAKPAVRRVLAERKALDALAPRARAFASQASTTSLETAATEAHLKVATSPRFTPTAYVPELGQMNEAVGAAFALPVGAISTPLTTGHAVFVFRVDRRVNADHDAWEKQKEQQRQQLLTTLRDQRVREYLDDLRQVASITDNRATIDAANHRATAT